MSVYLHDIPLSQAQARLKQALQDAGLWRVLGSEIIPLDENALGRVTSEPVWAKIVQCAIRVRTRAITGLSETEVNDLKRMLNIVQENLSQPVSAEEVA